MPGRSRGGNAARKLFIRGPGPLRRLPRTGRGHRGGPDDRARPPAGRWEGAILYFRGADPAPRFPTASTARRRNPGVATEKHVLSATAWSFAWIHCRGTTCPVFPEGQLHAIHAPRSSLDGAIHDFRRILITYSGALALAAAIPGPGVTALVARALGSGFRSSLFMALGLILGDLTYLTAVVLGLAIVAQTFGTVFLVIKWLGVLYCLARLELLARRNHRGESGSAPRQRWRCVEFSRRIDRYPW